MGVRNPTGRIVVDVKATRGINNPSVVESISNAASGVVVPIPTCAVKDNVKSMPSDKDKNDFITVILKVRTRVKLLIIL